MQFAIDPVNPANDRLYVQGWVVDCDRPHTPVVCNAYLNGRHQGTTLADHDRPDLIGPTCATGPAHGFAYGFPLECRLSGGLVELRAMGVGGAEFPFFSQQVRPETPPPVSITDGAITVYFSLNEGGSIVGIRATWAPEIDNFIDGAAPYGRGVQFDIGSWLATAAFNPTEAGSETRGAPVLNFQQKSPAEVQVLSHFLNWHDSESTGLLLNRSWSLQASLLISNYSIINFNQDPIHTFVTQSVYANPDVLNFTVPRANDHIWAADPNLRTAADGTTTLTDLHAQTYALAFGNKPGRPDTYHIFAPDVEATGYPPTTFTGMRTLNVSLQAARYGSPYVGEWALALAPMPAEAHKRILAWLRG